MLLQEFSKTNIEKLYLEYRRKGFFYDDYFGNAKLKGELKKKTEQIKENQIEIRDTLLKIRKCKKDEDWDGKDVKELLLRGLNKAKVDLNIQKSELISDHVIIHHKKKKLNFSLEDNLLDFNGVKKKVYTLKKDNITEEFYLKHLQNIFSRLYKVKQADRNLITKQIKELLHSKYKYSVLRLDIKEFYESIDSSKLMAKINSDNLLSPELKNSLTSILLEYKKRSGSKMGIPRGIGISAFLAELYMRDFDKEFSNRTDVIYLARYVDDIVIFTTGDAGSLKKEIRSFLKKEKGLYLNLKSKIVKNNGLRMNFEYLGYKFDYLSDVKISLSSRKIRKYKEAIKNIFHMYKQDTQGGTLWMHNDLMVKRLKYLAENTIIERKKKYNKKIRVGIYFNNRLINETKCLDLLDNFLRKETKNQNLSPSMSKKISKISFSTGFKDKTFFYLLKSRYKKIDNVDYKKIGRYIHEITNI